MSTCYWPVRRLRRKTCVPVDAAVLAQQLPRGSPTLSGVAACIPCWDDNVFCSFSGTDVIATVASFLNVPALGRCLRLEKRVCGDESLWRILLRQVSHSAFALSVSSARASVWNMMCRPCGVRPADARNSYVQLRNYRWCLDFCHREYRMFSAVIPVVPPRVEEQNDIHSVLRDGFTGRRFANLLPLHRLPLSALLPLDAAWNGGADPVSGGRGRMTCSLWLCNLRSREVVARVCRDAGWGPDTGVFRFYISEVLEWEPHGVGRVLEIWVPFKCSCNVEGAYDLSCSVEVFVADDETVDPRDSLMWDAPAFEWGRQRADSQDLMCALSGCALRSSFPDADAEP